MVDRDEVKELFSQASELSPERRERFLSRACNGNAELRSEVESLLSSHEDASSYFNDVANEVLPGAVRDLSTQENSRPGSDRLIGTTVGQYVIEEYLGGGGMGVVYKARHTTLDQYAAIKFLPLHLSEDAEAKARFTFEAKAAFALDHANVCTIYDIGETPEGRLFIVMAYYEGKTLKRLIASEPLSPERATDYAAQVSEGLLRAHIAGLVHRDIKPANLFVTTDDIVKILDFGVATGTSSAPVTKSGRTLGTIAYMSPEQASGGKIDLRTDIWSLGVVWFEMLTGSRPFDAEYDQAVVYNILNSDPPDLTDTGVSVEMTGIILRCLEKSPDDRYQSAADLFADIYRLRRAASTASEPRVAGPSSKPGRSPSGFGAGADSPIVQKAAHRRTKRAKIFIGYKRDVEDDANLAAAIAEDLGTEHTVFVDTMMAVGARWVQRIEREISSSDYFITLLSSRSVNSEMVIAEIELASRIARDNGDVPLIIPVRVNYARDFAYPLSSYLNEINWSYWESDDDTERVLQEIKEAIETGELSSGEAEILNPIADDTGPIPEPHVAAQPLVLESPEGTMDPQSEYYLERQEDELALRTIARAGVTLTIKGPRQMGKSSLLLRTMMAAREAGKRVVFLDFQLFDSVALQNGETFFKQFCSWVTDELELDDEVEEYWRRPLGNSQRCTRYFARHLLKKADAPIVLAMDEVERVFDTAFRSDFFSMLRSWHNDRAIDPRWKRLDLALVTSTEPYQLIENLNQSPFNVGEVLSLSDFTDSDVRSLNGRMGNPLKDSDIDRLMDLIGGHPYLIRRALYLLVGKRIDLDELIRTASSEKSPFGDHLRYHFFRLHNNARLVEAMRTVVNGGQLAQEELYWRLRGAGLVRREGARVMARCRLYADYFKARLDA